MLLSYNFLMMKKLTFEILGWTVALFVVVGIFYGYELVTDNEYHLKNGEKFQYTSGDSMGKGSEGERRLIVDTLATPKIGDIVSFECLVDKCHHVVTVHRLVGIDSKGCMKIVGDNQNDSWDTNDYGCLMPDEIKILGVVVDK